MDRVIETDLSHLKMFIDFDESLSKKSKEIDGVREKVEVIEKKVQKLLIFLQQIHQKKDYKALVGNADSTAESFRDEVNHLLLFMKNCEQPFTLSYLCRQTIQKVSYAFCLVHYIKQSELLSIQDLWSMLGLDANLKDRQLILNIEDYLFGLLMLTSELSRFAVNCVTLGDVNKPKEILDFVLKIQSGYSLLNLKNDALRKRFDGLKYDVKKLEQVTYDLKIRGLLA